MRKKTSNNPPLNPAQTDLKSNIKIYLLICFQCVALSLSAQKDFSYLPPKFQNLTLDDGLSNLAIHSICQDDLGYMWIGTARGLNRYDGISFKHYFYSIGPNSLYHDNILDLHKTPNGDLLCATLSGLNILDIKKEQFAKVKSPTLRFTAFATYDSTVYASSLVGGMFAYNEDKVEMTRIKNLPANIVIDQLITDKETGIWGRSRNNKFIINYNPSTSLYEKYFLPNTDTLRVGGSMSLINGKLIISSSSNITVFNIKNRRFQKIPKNLFKLNVVRDKSINFITEVEKGILWIGTKGNGLYVYNTAAQTLITFTKISNRNTVISHDLTCLYKDNANNIWLGTFDRGMEVSFERRKNFNFDIVLKNFIKDDFTTSICTDYIGNYYIGSRHNGLHIYNSKTKETKTLTKKNSFIKDDHIRSTFLSSTNDLWISSEKELQILNLTNGKYKTIELPQPNRGLVCFCEMDGKIFAGSDQQGLLVFSLKGELEDYSTDLGKNITQLLVMENNKLLVAAYGPGLFEYDYKTKKSRNFTEKLLPRRTNFREIITCYYDSKDNLWVGNFKYGLYRISKNSNRVNVFNMESGLPSNDITGIIEDNAGNIWVSTAYGLSMLKDSTFTNYSYNEGLENIQFHQKAVLKDEQGTLFFGGNFGLTFFNPRVLDLEKAKSPNIILDKLMVSNRKVNPDDDTKILDRHLALTTDIKLTHHYPIFSIEFKGFDYVAAKDLKYAYKLEGFDKEWNDIENRTFASFNNLRPGNYVFKVKAQNNNGVWSEEPAQLRIKIRPAPWFTLAAIIGYFLLAVLLTYASFRLILRGKLYKKELEVEHNERVREKEISQMKMKFFTNISHEIRTPLTLIKGNVDYLVKELQERNLTLQSTSGLRNSTERLLRLINQLLSVRQLERDTLDLSIKEDDILSTTHAIVESFRFTSNIKHINITVNSEFKALIVAIDKDKYEKILYNLLSNSIKFAKNNGFIKINIAQKGVNEINKDFKVDPSHKNFVEISVTDNGKGISKEDLPHIFDRFVHYKDKQKPDYSGTGIGLDFTKRLLELHNGDILVSSIEKEETCFCFILPVGKIRPSEHIKQKTIQETSDITPEVLQSDDSDLLKKTILLVEDDIELNKFIRHALSDLYKVIPTYDGKEALKAAKIKLPDIIISDVMMPEMDGFTLCKHIREDQLLSHIPIVLLTAKADADNKVLGYQYGADEYITKPFDLHILKVRIHNLIKQRAILQEYYKKALPFEFKPEKVNQFEINFMKKINQVVHENYASSEFNVNLLAENMNMSRTSFYRKFMSITDISPKDYITNFRINKAIELIQTGTDSFGEISFTCGFSSQSIFSTAFKRAKGLSPLQFKKSLKEGTSQ